MCFQNETCVFRFLQRSVDEKHLICFQNETCVFRFLRRSVDEKHLMCFQSETSVFKFLLCSVDGARVPPTVASYLIRHKRLTCTYHFRSGYQSDSLPRLFYFSCRFFKQQKERRARQVPLRRVRRLKLHLLQGQVGTSIKIYERVYFH